MRQRRPKRKPEGRLLPPLGDLYSHVRELYAFSGLAAALLYSKNRPAFYIFLGSTMAWLLWEAWRSLDEHYPGRALIATAARKVASRLTRRAWARRAARVGVLAALASGCAGWFLWSAADDIYASTWKMHGDINVLVAPFGDEAQLGFPPSSEGREIAVWLAGELSNEFAQSSATKVEVARLDGSVPSEAEALKAGQDHGATIVVYGTVYASSGSAFVSPKYAFTGRGSEALTSVDVAELVGATALGKRIGPITIAELEQSAELTARSKVVIQFLDGLVHLLAADNQAEGSFRDTIAFAKQAGLPDNEVLHEFLGLALAQPGTVEAYAAARPEFGQALAINKDYARAYIGLANSWYLTGLDLYSADDVRQAAMLYDQALTARDQPSGPILRAKAHLGRGNSFLVLAQLVGENNGDLARDEYNTVLSLDDGCGSLAWWDPRSWGPWKELLDSRPDYCDALAGLIHQAKQELGHLDKIQTPQQTSVATPASTGVRGQSQTTATIASSSAAAAVGTTADVEINVLGVGPPGLGAWTVDVSYDTSTVSVVDCSAVNGVCNPQYKEGTVRITGATATGLLGDASLATITIRCKAAGTSPLAVTVVTFADTTAGEPRDITPTFQDGSVTCS